MFEEFNTIVNEQTEGAKIVIIGVGGGGMNAVNKMAEDQIQGVEFIVANTDQQALNDSIIQKQILLGKESTKGLGAGAHPEIGKKAAEESLDEIEAAVAGADLVFVAAGLGGGTGTGAAPVIAEAAKKAGALVIGIVTTPFSFEGGKRGTNSVEGLKNLSSHVDSIIVISNDRLLDELGEISFTESFKYADAILKLAVRTIADLINEHSIINLDFADVRTVIEGQGAALIGVGKASGEQAAVEAAINAINSPILESSIEGASNAIVNVAGSSRSLTIKKAQEAVETIKEAAASNMDIMFGITNNESLGDEIVVSVIATGLKKTRLQVEAAQKTTERLAFADDTDIEKYREGSTKEFNPEAIKELTEDNNGGTFEGFSLLDDDEEQSIDDLLG
jgi:cell division protein FtsZ